MNNTINLLNELKALDSNELKNISKKILQMLNGEDGVSSSASLEKVITCRKCSDENVVKNGKDKNGNQRYKCRNCGATFISTSYSVISHTHCSLETWEKYVELLLNKASLKKCAEECKISVRTAFLWRHKILNALQKDQENRLLGGIVELDELYLPISYKGNHKKSKKFVMPRPAHLRGTDSREQIGSRACLMFSTERNGQSYGEVLGKGQPTIAMLSHAFDERILPESIVITDKAVGTRNYFSSKESVQLFQMMAHVKPKSMNSPPEVRGALHIQNINNMHARFRRFIYTYNGVSTKYLNHYLSLFIWLENNKAAKEFNPLDDLSSYLMQNNTYTTNNTFLSFPPIPNVA